MKSLKLFYAFSETLDDISKSMVETELPVPAYGGIAKIPAHTHTHTNIRESLTHSECYMDDVISTVQVGPKYQH